jgi:type IV fimbrial biogenesis protein FimT
MFKDTQQSKGFTLYEILIVLAITGVLVALAAPGFTETIQKNLMVTQMNELHTSLNHARSEAIKRSTNISICVTKDNGVTCKDAGKHQHHFHDGWMVFVDINRDGNFNAGDELLRVHNKFPQQDSKFGLGDKTVAITFLSSGLAFSGAGETFTLCDARGVEHVKGLIIGPTGRPQPTETVDAHDVALVCPL